MDLRTIKKHNRGNTTNNSSKNSITKIIEFAGTDISFFKRFTDKDKERFFTELGVLLNAGVDLQTVLEISVASINGKDKLKLIYTSLIEYVSEGKGISDALMQTGSFNNFDCYSIQIGENTGELGVVVNKLAQYYQKKNAQRRKTLSALSYPIIVLITTVLAVLFMLKFVVPMFANTLVQFGGELPVLTSTIISLSDYISKYFWLSIALLTGTTYLFYRYRSNAELKKYKAAFLLKIPYIGKVVKKTHLLRFTQAMELLLSANIGIVESLQLVQKMVDFHPLSIALLQVKEDVLKGDFFYEAIAKQQFFESSMITIIKIGEEVNQLDRIFLQLSKQYETELDYSSGVLMTILEPLMILLLAVLIGVILVAMYLPMFKIGTIIK